MAGIETITGRILEEAKKEADRVVSAANGKALDIAVAAGDEIRKAKAENEERIARDKKTYEARTLSSCDILKKKAILLWCRRTSIWRSIRIYARWRSLTSMRKT